MEVSEATVVNTQIHKIEHWSLANLILSHKCPPNTNRNLNRSHTYLKIYIIKTSVICIRNAGGLWAGGQIRWPVCPFQIYDLILFCLVWLSVFDPLTTIHEWNYISTSRSACEDTTWLLCRKITFVYLCKWTTLWGSHSRVFCVL